MPTRKTPKVPDLKTLADPLKAAQLWQKGPACTMGVALDTLPEDQVEYLQKALDNPNARGIDIAQALEAIGVRMEAHTVQRHRSGRCRCGK